MRGNGITKAVNFLVGIAVFTKFMNMNYICEFECFTMIAANLIKIVRQLFINRHQNHYAIFRL